MEKPNRRHRTRKTGLPPGTLVHIGEKRDFTPLLTLFHYDAESLKEDSGQSLENYLPYCSQNGVTWINIDGIHQVELIEKIGKHFNLHPLTLEDLVNNDQRPKIEDHEEYLFLVLKMLFSHPDNGSKREKITIEQVSLILGDHYVLSFQERLGGDVFDGVRDRLRNNHGRIRKLGPDYLAYSLIDAIVDHYFVILEKTGERLENLEVELLGHPDQRTLRSLQILKRDMIDLRKSIWPLREVAAALERNDSKLISEVTKKYLRDVYDHTIHVIDTLEVYRDLLGGMLEIYLSSISNHLNGIMKVLTMIATIFIPLTFIVGVYGMNFRHMPELQWEYGYLLIWLVMLLIAGAMFIFFKRRKWL